MTNEHRGEASLKLDGKDHIVVFDWTALAKLQSKYGRDFDKKVAEATASLDVGTLADVLSIGLERHNPMTPDEITKLSPPLINVAGAIVRGINLAFYGVATPAQEEAKAEAEENPPQT